MDEKDSNIIIIDDQGDMEFSANVSDRIFELRDELSLDIISRNVVDKFNEPKIYETTNYVTKFKETYNLLKESTWFDGDESIINNAVQELTDLIILNLNDKFSVGVGQDIDDNLIIDLDEFLDHIECLYNFFIVRRYTNIADYFKAKLIQNKFDILERYKMAMDDKTYSDLFLSQDKKKYDDSANAIIVHYIGDIISDIRSEITSAYNFFKEIVNLDLYEEYNNRMNELLINYGAEFVIYNDQEAVEKYLSILDNDEVFVSLRNELLSKFLEDARLTGR